MTGSAFKKANARWAEYRHDSDELDARRVEIVGLAGGLIKQMQDRGMTDVREPVSQWLSMAQSDEEHPTVRVYAMIALDSVIGNLAAAIHYNREDADSGNYDDAFSHNMATRSGQLAKAAPAVEPLLKGLDIITEHTSEPQVRSTAVEVRLSLQRALGVIERHRSNGASQAINNNASGAFPAYNR